MIKCKPKVMPIHAIQFTGDNVRQVNEFMGTQRPEDNVINIFAPKGVIKVNLKDWVIRGISGNYFSCPPDIFETMYEKVEE